MTAFDASAAAERYAEMDESDLVNIAYLDSNYLPQAKELAVRELERRGVAANKKVLGQARREIQFRKDAVAQRGYESIGRMQTFKQKTGEVMLLVMLWSFALGAPMTMKWSAGSFNWMALIPLGAWVVYVVDAAREYRGTGRRRLVYLVAVPAILATIGILVRLATG